MLDCPNSGWEVSLESLLSEVMLRDVLALLSLSESDISQHSVSAPNCDFFFCSTMYGSNQCKYGYISDKSFFTSVRSSRPVPETLALQSFFFLPSLFVPQVSEICLCMICGVKKHCLWWVVIRLLADLDMMMSALEGTEYMQTRKHMSLGSVSPPPPKFIFI